MAKPDQVLIIEPQNELKFKGPFTVPVTSYMKLTNPFDKRVLFKIKTTAPKRYCVRPNSGILDGNANIEIAICLQPFIFDPTEKNKHKFMVQTVFAPEGEGTLEQLWKEANTELMMDSKLKCVFELPPGPNEVPNEEPSKVSPKVSLQQQSPVPPAVSLEVELEKAATEVKMLREEESSMRQENLKLKEEIIRLKHSSSSGISAQTSKYTPAAPQPQGISVTYLVLCIAIALIGVILGKYIL